MSKRIKTDFVKDEPLPENIFPDFEWVAENRITLYEKYGDCVVVVYQKEVIGVGKTYSDALANAEGNLADDVELITAIQKYIGNPYSIGTFRRRETQE
jgi:hypothetical protein